MSLNKDINASLEKIKCDKGKDKDLKKLLEEDYGDTLEHLIKTTHLSLEEKQRKKISKATFNENTRIAIGTLNALFLGCIEEYEKRLPNTYENKLYLADLFQLYLLNRLKLKDKKQGKKVVIQKGKV